MADWYEDVLETVKYFDEINHQIELVRNTEEYKQWYNAPFEEGVYYEVKLFKIVLWRDTPQEKDMDLELAKGLKWPTPQLQRKFRK